MSRNSSAVKTCACSACTALWATNTSQLDLPVDAERVGLIPGLKEVFQNPKVAVFTVTTVVAFILLLLFVLNIVPWGTGRGCWAQC